MHLDATKIIVPNNHRQASRLIEWNYWARAKKDKIGGLRIANFYRIEDIPKGAKIIDGKWVHSQKTNTNEQIDKFKVRLSGCGD